MYINIISQTTLENLCFMLCFMPFDTRLLGIIWEEKPVDLQEQARHNIKVRQFNSVNPGPGSAAEQRTFTLHILMQLFHVLRKK